VIIRLYIYILIIFHSSCQCPVGVFARPMHSTSKFAMTVLSKCVLLGGFLVDWSQVVTGWNLASRHPNMEPDHFALHR